MSADAPAANAGVPKKAVMRAQLRHRRVDSELAHLGPFRLDLTAIFVGAELVDQDLDPRLVDIVAPAVAIVDAQARLENSSSARRR